MYLGLPFDESLSGIPPEDACRKDEWDHELALPSRATPPTSVQIPGPGGVPIQLSPRDFLKNLPALATQARNDGSPNTWQATIPYYGQIWKLTFKGDNRASLRVYNDDEGKMYEALRLITEAVERGRGLLPAEWSQETNLSLRVVKIPNSSEQVVMSRDLPAIAFTRGLIERLFEDDFHTKEPALEQFEFKVPQLRLFHQRAERTIDILVSYQYGRTTEYPDFLRLDDTVKRFFTSYPGMDDYWETVNKRLVRTLLRDYPMLERIAVTVVAHPDNHVRSCRASTVMMNRAQLALEEAA